MGLFLCTNTLKSESCNSIILQVISILIYSSEQTEIFFSSDQLFVFFFLKPRPTVCEFPRKVYGIYAALIIMTDQNHVVPLSVPDLKHPVGTTFQGFGLEQTLSWTRFYFDGVKVTNYSGRCHSDALALDRLI